MATNEEIERMVEESKEAVRRNPLLKLDLGALVLEMRRLTILDPNVVGPIGQMPMTSIENYKRYMSLAEELKRRECKYNSYKAAPCY